MSEAIAYCLVDILAFCSAVLVGIIARGWTNPFYILAMLCLWATIGVVQLPVVVWISKHRAPVSWICNGTYGAGILGFALGYLIWPYFLVPLATTLFFMWLVIAGVVDRVPRCDPAGSCPKCGHARFSLSSQRCQKCGTEFEPRGDTEAAAGES